VGFGYYLVLTHEPRYNTYTWTLDYEYNSDFDDNTGHWQVVPHPTKAGWSRVLYSTEVKLFPWIPEFVGALCFPFRLSTESGTKKTHPPLHHFSLSLPISHVPHKDGSDLVHDVGQARV
jgi:hypothetical protein